MNVVLAADAAWGGMGLALVTEQGPTDTAHVRLSGATWRWPALGRWLDGDVARIVADGELLRGAADPPLRLVVEKPPAVYSGVERWNASRQGHLPSAPAGKAGNQSATCYGLGRLAGALEWWWIREHPDLGYPWLVEPREWRTWMKVGGTGRVARKRAAVQLCRLAGWGRFLDPFPWDDAPEHAGGAMGDVAEAVLLGVGAARNATLAPPGPRRPRAAPTPTVPTRPTRSP